MTSAFMVIGGILLVSFSFLIILSATPTVYTEMQTGPGSHFENASITTKQAVNTSADVASLLSIIMFVAGFGMAIKGL